MGSINSCRNVCIRYKADKPGSGSRYLNGQVYCGQCCIFMTTNDRLCPCCGLPLRRKPLKNKFREKVIRNRDTMNGINNKVVIKKKMIMIHDNSTGINRIFHAKNGRY